MTIGLHQMNSHREFDRQLSRSSAHIIFDIRALLSYLLYTQTHSPAVKPNTIHPQLFKKMAQSAFGQPKSLLQR